MEKLLQHQGCRGALRIMKILSLQAFIALTLASFAYAHDLRGQGILDKEITVEFEETSLKKVLLKIERIAGVKFTYSPSVIAENQKVSIQASNQKLAELLDRLLTPIDISYKVIADRISLYKASELGSYLGNKVRPTENPEKLVLAITGKVVDENSQPIPGVNVLEKGTTNGTTTDAAGTFSLNLLNEESPLIFSFIGYISQEVALNGRSVIDVVLKEDVQTLDEVVVIGYGVQKKVNVLGSVAAVNSEELNSAPVSMISNAIAGRLPGAIVQQGSGEPGDNAATILIRGKATLGNNAPLIVVDGIPGRDMNSLQPTDIESITVLKDASAAIYGARAANGVILITTKRGEAGTPATFSYGFYQGALMPTKIPEMADAATYAQMIREMQSYRGIDESNMLFSSEDVEKYRSGKYPWTHPNTDWFAEVMKDYSTTRNHHLSVSGGTENVTYYGSFASQLDDGLYKNSASSYKRYNIKANVNAKVNKFLSVGIDITGAQENSMFPTRGEANVFSILRRSKPTDPAFFPNGLPGPDINWGDNPAVISGFDPGFNDKKVSRLNTIFSATFLVPGLTGLSLSGYYAYDKYFDVEKLWEKPFTLYSLDKQAYLDAGNDGSQDGSDFLVANFPKGLAPEPRLNDSYNDSDSKVVNFKANYEKTIGDVHHISAFVSMESSKYLSKGISAFRRYFISGELPYLFAGGNTDWSNSGNVSLDSRLNYFGRAMYNYKETYLVQFSLRRDGSLRFSEANGRWGTFPSILAGWRISNENFWKNNIAFINFLKLKASFGQMGNDQVAPFQYLTNYAFGTGKVLTSAKVYQSGLIQSGIPNPFITWEVANVSNVGFESAFLNDKVTFNADFFYQRRDQILVKRDASVPAFTGISLPDENFGIVDNKGFEIELGYQDSKADFLYSIGGNFAFARNKVVEIDEPAKTVPWQVLTGHQQGVLLLYKSAGVFKDEEQVNSLPHVPGARPGDIIIEDVSGDGEITNDDKIIFDKTADPQITFGVTFNLVYKNWELRGLIQGTGTTMRSIASDAQTGTIGNYYAFEAEDRWTIDNTDASKPRAYEREEEYWRTSYPTDYNYQKGGYARLKNIQISYTVPQRIRDAVSLKDAKIYFSGQNLFLIWDQNQILDPEAGSMLSYPIMKVYSLGLNVAF